MRTCWPAALSANIEGCVRPCFGVPFLRKAKRRLYHCRGAGGVVWGGDGRDGVARLRLLVVKIVCNFYNAAIGVDGSCVYCYRRPRYAIYWLANPSFFFFFGLEGDGADSQAKGTHTPSASLEALERAQACWSRPLSALSRLEAAHTLRYGSVAKRGVEGEKG